MRIERNRFPFDARFPGFAEYRIENRCHGSAVFWGLGNSGPPVDTADAVTASPFLRLWALGLGPGPLGL
ncbi:MAG: hypothetical protein R3C53_26505 [Pirellulaceae bacterium]